MNEDFNVLDLFREWAKEQERPVDQSEARVLKFQKMHLERINNITLLISDSIRSRVPKIYDLLRSQAARRDLRVIYAWNHSKVILMRTGEHRFVVEGSGNFSENALYEQYIYMNDERIYDFRKECIERAADR